MVYEKTDKLSIRERKFIKGVAEGLSPTAAMKAAGYTEYTANSCAGPKLREPKIQASIQELMEKRGLTKDKLLNKLDEGLGAEREEDKPDFAIRHKYLDTAFKLGSHYPSDKVEHSGEIKINVTKTVVASGD